MTRRSPAAWLRERREQRRLEQSLRGADPSTGQMPWLIRKPGCPVCRAVAQRTRGLLFWFREEYYNSAPWLGRICRSWGFCRYHTWDLVTVGARHELTYGAQFLIRQAEARLAALEAALGAAGEHGPRSGDAVIAAVCAALTPAERCPVCSSLAEDEWDLIDLLGSLANPPALALYMGGDGLCESHYARGGEILARANSSRLTELREVQSRVRRAHLPSGGAGDPAAAARLIRLMAGWRFAPGPQASLSRSDGGATMERESYCVHPVDSDWTRGELPPGAALVSLGGMPGCCLCRLRESRRYELFQGLISDADRAMLALPGLCRVHAWELLDCDAGGALLPVLLAVLQSRLADGQTVAARERPAAVPLSAGCAACREEAAADSEAVAQLPPANRDRKRTLVCLPHLVMMARRDAGPPLQHQIAHLRGALATLSTEVSEYFRKLDYRFSSEPKGREQTAGLRALALLSGPPPLYRREGVESLSAFGGWSYESPVTAGKP